MQHADANNYSRYAIAVPARPEVVDRSLESHCCCRQRNNNSNSNPQQQQPPPPPQQQQQQQKQQQEQVWFCSLRWRGGDKCVVTPGCPYHRNGSQALADASDNTYGTRDIYVTLRASCCPLMLLIVWRRLKHDSYSSSLIQHALHSRSVLLQQLRGGCSTISIISLVAQHMLHLCVYRWEFCKTGIVSQYVCDWINCYVPPILLARPRNMNGICHGV